MSASVAAVVVTFNRRDLLAATIESLMRQSRAVDAIVLVDNASTDGTVDMIRRRGWLTNGGVELLRLDRNLGGAGGFEAGLRHAIGRGFGKAWLMDDDACPRRDALERILAEAVDERIIYGSLPVSGDRIAWALRQPGGSADEYLTNVAEITGNMDVEFIPFLGLLVSASVVSRIGYPDGSFFIAKDDVEYSIRARRAGIPLKIVSSSRIEHPVAQSREVPILGRKFRTLSIPPWKRYYSVRNRIFIARRHLGWALYYQTLPGSLVHLAISLIDGPQRLRQLWAFIAGTVDGLTGRSGRRHERWRILT